MNYLQQTGVGNRDTAIRQRLISAQERHKNTNESPHGKINKRTDREKKTRLLKCRCQRQKRPRCNAEKTKKKKETLELARDIRRTPQVKKRK